MTVSSFEGKTPQLGAGSWVHPSADVIGDVQMGERCWIGPGARLRGDYGRIVLGDCCAVEDNCVIHARPGETCAIGSWVTLGHGCVVHNAAIVEDYAIIGMHAVVSDWSEIGEWAVVAEGAVVPQRFVVPAGRIAVGVPARISERRVDDAFREAWRGFKQLYVDLCRRYAEGNHEVIA
jgi:phenylacetic acid degradation protein